MAVVSRFVDKVKQLYLVYELRTAISMLEPWEKRLFNSILLLLIAMSCYTTYIFLPRYTRSVIAYFSS
uniref:Putative serine palmitoyltransferase small subunit a n=1 Tax=Parasteatoda tepidariorum TaxID=114398 RepID=A0A2L2Y0Q6_PARTP